MDADSIRRFQKKLKEIQEKDREYERKFGKVKPIIHTTVQGSRFVAIGDEIHYSDKWKTFPDFLISYIWSVLSKEWASNQLVKPDYQIHQIIKWWKDTVEFMSKQPVNENGLCESKISGPYAALLLLAYDLYLIRHHSKLQERVINRLKDPNQFQGARYELFCLSSCIRANFEIEFEDEDNRETKHAEFTAIHKLMKATISIEAKSKHRSGVLGYNQTKGIDDKIKLKVVSLINQALMKKSKHPLVVFVDTNLPFEIAESFYNDREFKKFQKLLERVKKMPDGRDIFNLILFTNTPHHYTEIDEPDPRKHYLHVFSQKPVTEIKNIKILHELISAVEKYGHVPVEFEDTNFVF